MNVIKEEMLLYAVTDRAWTGEKTLYEQVKDALEGGVTIVQLREKHLHGEELLNEAKMIAKLCHQYGVKLIIDDDVDVVLASGADGVHVGQNDMAPEMVRKLLGPDKVIGVTCKTVEQAKQAEKAGADYIGSGAMFHTTTKTDTYVISHQVFNEICDAVEIPVVAIGGISKENLHELKDLKMSGVALVSAIFAQKDITKASMELYKMLKEELV